MKVTVQGLLLAFSKAAGGKEDGQARRFCRKALYKFWGHCVDEPLAAKTTQLREAFNGLKDGMIAELAGQMEKREPKLGQ